MVLEHLHDPLGALRRLHDAATPHGWLVLSVPNCGSWEFSAFKGDWYALHVPNHLTHFTPESISRLLELAGWRVERITCQRVVGDFFGSLAFMLERRRRLPRVTAWIRSRLDSPTRLHLLLLPLAIILAAFRQTGRMNVWARRVEQTG